MKVMIEWEDIDLKELFDRSNEMDDFEEPPSSLWDLVLEKYLEQDYHFLILHTNFNLSRNRCLKISRVPGVERLSPLSRYKAMINIAKLYDPDSVKGEIRTLINKFFYRNELEQDSEPDVEEGV